jgi:enoyl-CoA hydratase
LFWETRSRKRKTVYLGTSHDFTVEHLNGVCLLRLCSAEGTNRLTRDCVRSLQRALLKLDAEPRDLKGLVLSGNDRFFSAGADLSEVAALSGPEAHQFARMGQELMNVVDGFRVPVIAAIQGYCMGGGLDLALACDLRIAHPQATFGHRGAALGLLTGWGGTQRLARLAGKAHALEMFITAEKIAARRAWEIGLVNELADDPVQRAVQVLSAGVQLHPRRGLLYRDFAT